MATYPVIAESSVTLSHFTMRVLIIIVHRSDRCRICLSLIYHLCITGFLKVIVEVLQYKYVLINRSVCIASGHPGVRSGNIRV